MECFGENAVYFVDNRWGTGTGLPVKTVSGQGFGSLVILIQILILSFAIKETGNERVHPLAKIGSKTKQRPKLLFQPVTHYCPLFYYFLICFKNCACHREAGIKLP